MPWADRNSCEDLLPNASVQHQRGSLRTFPGFPPSLPFASVGRPVANDARKGHPGSRSTDSCLAGLGRDRLQRGGARPAEGGRRRPPQAGVEPTAQQERQRHSQPWAPGAGDPGGLRCCSCCRCCFQRVCRGALGCFQVRMRAGGASRAG